MRTALDSSVLLDVILDDARHADKSEAAIRESAVNGAILVGECVIAEIRPALGDGDLARLMADWNIQFQPSSLESSALAGEMYLEFLRRRRSQAKHRVLPDFLIGASTHSLAEAQAAQDSGATFITCGPVYETASKRASGAPLGLTAFERIARAVTLPVYALGGINADNLLEPFQHGAAGIAAISLWQNAEQMSAMIARVRERSWLPDRDGQSRLNF